MKDWYFEYVDCKENEFCINAISSKTGEIIQLGKTMPDFILMMLILWEIETKENPEKYGDDTYSTMSLADAAKQKYPEEYKYFVDEYQKLPDDKEKS